MKAPAIVVLPSVPTEKPLIVRLMWMAILWGAGVACVLVVSLILREVLHR